MPERVDCGVKTSPLISPFVTPAIKDNPSHKVVFVTHAPPYGTNIDLVVGEHCGNKSFTTFIEKYQPNLAVAGHLHENFGKRGHVGKTLVVDPGPYCELLTV